LRVHRDDGPLIVLKSISFTCQIVGYPTMGVDTYEQIDAILSSVQEDVTDPELKYNLRTARQLCYAMKEQYVNTQQAAGIDE